MLIEVIDLDRYINIYSNIHNIYIYYDYISARFNTTLPHPHTHIHAHHQCMLVSALNPVLLPRHPFEVRVLTPVDYGICGCFGLFLFLLVVSELLCYPCPKLGLQVAVGGQLVFSTPSGRQSPACIYHERTLHPVLSGGEIVFIQLAHDGPISVGSKVEDL